MNMASDTVITLLEPWQAHHYQSLSQRFTLTQAMASLRFFERHLRMLRARGDTAAAAGVVTALRLSLLKLASVQATSASTLGRKVTALARHHAVWADQPMTAAVIDAAIVADASALGLGALQQERLQRQMRGEP